MARWGALRASRILSSRQQRPFGGSCWTGRGIEQYGPGCVLLWQCIAQDHVQQRGVNPNAAVVFDVAELPEAIHEEADARADRKSTRLNSSHLGISYAV